MVATGGNFMESESHSFSVSFLTPSPTASPIESTTSTPSASPITVLEQCQMVSVMQIFLLFCC